MQNNDISPVQLKLWKNSILRFYWLNARWNIGYWMNAKPCYEECRYTYKDDELDLDKNLDNLNIQMQFDQKAAVYKKFKGYVFRGGIHLDNPGAQYAVDSETRAHWLKKGWI